MHKKLGDLFSRVYKYRKNGVPLDAVTKAAMNTLMGSQGGFLVPPELVLKLDEQFREPSLFHSFARQQPMSSRECMVPAYDLTASHAAGTSPLLAGFTAAWTEEGTARSTTTPSFMQGNLISRDLTCIVYASNQLVMDGGEALGAYLENQFLYGLRWYVEYACFNGAPGAKSPVGIVQAPATHAVTRAGAGHVSITDVVKMTAALIPACYERSIWVCHPTVIVDLAALTTYSVNISILERRMAGLLMGRPMYVTEKVPPLGTTGDIILFDPMQYVLGTRQIEFDWTQEEPAAFASNQTAFGIIWRGDGQPLVRGTFTAADGSTTMACFVKLTT